MAPPCMAENQSSFVRRKGRPHQPSTLLQTFGTTAGHSGWNDNGRPAYPHRRPARLLARQGRPYRPKNGSGARASLLVRTFAQDPVITGRFQINATPEDADITYFSESGPPDPQTVVGACAFGNSIISRTLAHLIQPVWNLS
jgi:hypothetical protein